MTADTRASLLAQARVLVASYSHAARAVRREASETHVHGYRIAARRMQALLALWRPALCHPKLERRLQRAVGRLSALRDAQVYAARFGASSTIVLPRVTVLLFSGLLARWLDALEQTPDTSGLARHYRRNLARRLDGAIEPT